MRARHQTVEHRRGRHIRRPSFGPLKSWMGSTHFQMHNRVSTEMSLHVLAYKEHWVERQPLSYASPLYGGFREMAGHP